MEYTMTVQMGALEQEKATRIVLILMLKEIAAI
jgi:hypothetical protein